MFWDLPGGPLVKTLYFQCRECRFDPLSGNCAVPSRSVVSNSLRPHGLQPTRLLCPWGFSRQEYWCGLPCPPPGDPPNPRIKPRSPALQVDSLPSEPLGRPKNTGMGNLCLLSAIFPTQQLNWGHGTKIPQTT